jgi:cytochrome c
MRLAIRKATIAAVLLGVAAASPSAAQDASAGAKVFANVCGVCHSVAHTNAIGPSMAGVVGRRAGSVGGFHYSAAMAAYGKIWNASTLDAFINAPAATVPGTQMPFMGLHDAGKRANLIAFLATQK